MTKIPFGPSFYLDTEKCIGCGSCVRACQKQCVNHLALKKEGEKNKVVPLPNVCVYCGMCLLSCPVKAFSDLNSFIEIEKVIADKSKTVVCQIAPAVRTTIGEAFNLPPGTNATARLVAALKKLGFKHVFDTSLGADFTSVEEAKEALKRIKTNKNLPIFTSCCPAWVEFVLKFYPQYKENISSVRSPQAILGGLIKFYWAKKENLNPKEVITVSIMPCVAKKYEITLDKLKIQGINPIDYVFTTREIIQFLKNNQIDLAKISPDPLTDEWLLPSGAGIIYGATGGVSRSALRTAFHLETGKNINQLKFSSAKDELGIERITVDLIGQKMAIALADGLNEFKVILDDMTKNPKTYVCVEVMACPGGCIGGGGQPYPVSKELKEKRAQGLFNIDKTKKIRCSIQNPVVKKIYKEFLNSEEIINQICHTDH